MMSKIKYAVALFVLVSSIVGASLAQGTKSRTAPGAVKKVEAYLAKLDNAGYNGSLLVAVDGKPIISKGYGYSDVEGKIRNSPRTVFDTGSITKQFTAAAIMKLVMEKKLSVEDKVGEYFQNV